MRNEDTVTRMIAASNRRKPLLMIFLAILLAAPGIPVFGQPDRDATSLGIQGPRRVRADKRDATRVGIGVSARGQNNQPVKDLLVTLFLVPKRGGPGLLTATDDEMAQVKTGDDGIAWF
ncbi:MAG TPA: hypothetical protein VIX89_08045, partial [Bryobacteraceae bacterium]